MALSTRGARGPIEKPGGTPAGQEQLAFDHVPRDTGEPSFHLVRTVTMLVQLLRFHSLDYTWYQRSFELSDRQFSRDLQHLRKILNDLGLRISNRNAGRVTLLGGENWNRLGDRPRDQADALRAVARALGGPAAHELGAQSSLGEGGDRFLIFALPRLVADSDAAKVFEALKAAHAAKAKVQFRYRDPYGSETSRVVEPYRVVARAGRYYLVGYDAAPRKGWRYFAIDRIAAPPKRAGTFAPRTIPSAYLSCDAIGMLQRGGAATEVTIRLSPVVAESIVSRRWQNAQHIKTLPGGSVDITLTVADVDEAVRWALGFGAQARVVGPQRAVDAARRALDEMRRQYGAGIGAASKNRTVGLRDIDGEPLAPAGGATHAGRQARGPQ